MKFKKFLKTPDSKKHEKKIIKNFQFRLSLINFLKQHVY